MDAEKKIDQILARVLIEVDGVLSKKGRPFTDAEIKSRAKADILQLLTEARLEMLDIVKQMPLFDTQYASEDAESYIAGQSYFKDQLLAKLKESK